MKRQLVYCLFFLCLLGCTGCRKMEQNIIRETNGEVDEKQYIQNEVSEKESVTNENSEKEQILVLTYGNQMMTGMATTICDNIGAVHWDLSSVHEEKKKEEMNEQMKRSDLILIGTDKQISEFEFMFRNIFEEEVFAEKKTALFLINQENEAEFFEQGFKKWYPKAEILPTFTMQLSENIQDELGRMNGWLTTVLAYDRIKEEWK